MPGYIWPLSKSSQPDEMNTSFGPRIKNDRWDFHDGIDLPAEIGTKVFAMRAGIVHRAGRGGRDGFSSRHVVIKVNDPKHGTIYNVYLHLDSIGSRIVEGAKVKQGARIGTSGQDGAVYPHLHMEFRKATLKEIGSVHPLGFLPYTDTASFYAPVADRFNRLDQLMAARLLFGSPSKLEGDLNRIEVDLLDGAGVIETRVTDFNDKTSINEGNDDNLAIVNGLAVEGYQKSDMKGHKRTDLKYGIVVVHLPQNCDGLTARVIDVAGNVATSSKISVPNQPAVDQRLDFEDGKMPPAGWTALTSNSGEGTLVENLDEGAHAGARCMRCVDESTTEDATQRAAIQFPLPPGRFEWVAEGWFNPLGLDLKPGKTVFLLHFLSGSELSVAALIQSESESGILLAGLIVPRPDGKFRPDAAPVIIEPGIWRKWRLHILRLGTRETTAVLYLDMEGRMTERARLNWDTSRDVPDRVRAGIGRSSAGARATVLVDGIRVTECTALVDDEA